MIGFEMPLPRLRSRRARSHTQRTPPSSHPSRLRLLSLHLGVLCVPHLMVS